MEKLNIEQILHLIDLVEIDINRLKNDDSELLKHNDTKNQNIKFNNKLLKKLGKILDDLEN